MMTKEEYQKTLIRMWDSVRDDKHKGNPNCDGVDCQNCPTTSVCGSGVVRGYDMVEFVEEWGKEHPIKTNREVFLETVQEKFGDTISLASLNRMFEPGCAVVNVDCTGRNCETCEYKNFWDKEYKEVSKDGTLLPKKVTSTQKWIPVSERLPEDGERVLVTQKVRDSAIVYGTTFPFEKAKEKYITAWMPKPDPYKE